MTQDREALEQQYAARCAWRAEMKRAGLGAMVRNAILQGGLKSWDDIAEADRNEMLRRRNLGDVGVRQIRQALSNVGQVAHCHSCTCYGGGPE